MLKDKIIFLLFTLFLTSSFLPGFAQTTGSKVDEIMQSHDKIYVVMTVCLVILVVMLLYLIRIDFKISKKEKTNE